MYGGRFAEWNDDKRFHHKRDMFGLIYTNAVSYKLFKAGISLTT